MDKKVSESRTEQVQLITQSDLNGYKRLYGGRLMEWIDTVAGVTARRHSEKNITTAMVDTLQFKKAAYANDLIVHFVFHIHLLRFLYQIHLQTLLIDHTTR